MIGQSFLSGHIYFCLNVIEENLRPGLTDILEKQLL